MKCIVIGPGLFLVHVMAFTLTTEKSLARLFRQGGDKGSPRWIFCLTSPKHRTSIMKGVRGMYVYWLFPQCFPKYYTYNDLVQDNYNVYHGDDHAQIVTGNAAMLWSENCIQQTFT